MEHIGLLGILVNLLVALWVAVTVFQNHKSYDFPYLRPLFHYCLIYSLLVFFGLVALYVNLYLKSDLPQQERIPLLHDAAFFLGSLLEIGLVYSLFCIYLAFKDRGISMRANKWMTAGFSIFILSYGLKIFLPQGSVLRSLNIFHGYVFDNLIVFEIPVLILILASGKSEKDRKKIKLRRSFGWLFLLRYLYLAGMFLVFFILNSNSKEIVPRAVRYPVALVVFLLFSLAPFLWIKFFFRRYAESLLVIIEDREVLESVFKKYGISKRERDILKLILDGKSNKEIEEALFISYHTVKNHVYNLFQKIGVKNRFELIHFVTKFQKE